MNYIPLSVKTNYELLSSLIKIDDLCKYLSDNNITSVGITDSNMFGTMEFFDISKKYNIKPIIGLPININELNMILYAKNYKGYTNLLNLVSIKNTDTLTIDLLKKYNTDLICTTSDYKKYISYKEIYEEVYLSYYDKESKNNALVLTDKIVYIKENNYIYSSDKEYLVYLNLIRDGKTIEEFNNYKYDNHIDYDINEYDSETTIKFASLINIEIPKFSFELPKYSINSKELLCNLSKKGLNKRLNGNVPIEYLNRLEMELEVINSMNFADYFLIVYDFILYAKKNKILIGPGRGSAAGSLVSYSLGITEIDPIKFNLIFERFLNKDRVTMPDIDTDIEYLKRDEVINYVKNKYGKNKVCNIITFGTMQPKLAIRDIGRVLKINTSKIDILSKTIKLENTFKELENNLEYKRLINTDKELEELIRISKKLEGLKRFTGVHAAGVVISRSDLSNKVPLYVNGDTLLSGYTMEYLERLGLLKIDFLALKNLTIIGLVKEEIFKEKNISIDLNKIPLNDEKTINIFYNAKTSGIFQFESEGMKEFLKSLKVKTFDDLILAIALYRPGPKDMINTFINRRNGKEKVTYLSIDLKEILESTNGIIVYQEQILEVLKTVGNFTYSEADIIRRAMSKKKESIILKYREKFIEGALNNNYTLENANRIYDLVLKFSNYGFNKSHSVAYSIIAYQMAFLKVYYPSMFYKVLLDESIGSETKTKEYINEAKKLGLNFNLPDINISTDKYVSKSDKLYLPITSIKNIGKESTNFILNEREKGLFTSYIDFIKRTYKGVNSKVVENLIYSGTLNSFSLNKKTMIENLPSIIEYTKLLETLDETLVIKPEIINYEEYSKDELLTLEHNSLGFYLNNHPTSKYDKTNLVELININKYFDKYINLIVLIENIRVIETKKKDKMAFILASDETNSGTLILFPDQYKKYNNLAKGDIIKVNAKVEKRMSEYQLIVNKVEKM